MIAHVPRARILAVDDDPGLQRVIERVLGPHNDVRCAAGGPAALELAASFQPDVAIVDLLLPGMNGFEVMQRLQTATPDLDVILMTGNAEEPDAKLVQAITAGAFYFIQKPFDRRVLVALISRCLELRRLREEKNHYVRRLEHDLESARRFQRSLLPIAPVQFPPLAISARYVACRELAGDFFDYALADDGAVALLIADVVGHGTSAAMLTGVVKSAFHAAHVDGFDPLSVINRVKTSIDAFDADRFVTLCSARIDVRAGLLSYASAGHPPVIHCVPGTAAKLLNSTGPMVSSALGDMRCERAQTAFRQGDLLLFYTDGVTEAHGSGGMFGQARIMHILEKRSAGHRDLLDEILAAVSDHAAGRPLEDDMTLLAAEYLTAA